jgi:hypothetical protein
MMDMRYRFGKMLDATLVATPKASPTLPTQLSFTMKCTQNVVLLGVIEVSLADYMVFMLPTC